MKAASRLIVALTAIVWVSVAAQEPPLETWEQYQGPAAETFLKKAKVLGKKRLGVGVTDPYKLELELDGVRHNAVFKTIDDRKAGLTRLQNSVEMNFQDSWQLEVAAYQIDLIIGLRMVPATVERHISPDTGSVQWWVQSMISEFDRRGKGVEPPNAEAWERVYLKMQLFDQLIANVDRHLNNILVTKDFDLRLIDHSRSFRENKELGNARLLHRFSKSLLEGIAKLEFKDLKQRIGRYLLDNQIRAMLARRDAILALAKATVKDRGEAAVIYP
jgi:hypothetical protein